MSTTRSFFSVKTEHHLDENPDSIVSIDQASIPALGNLFLDAYLGTPDYDGESLQDAQTEIAETLQGKYGSLLKFASFAIRENNELVCGILVSNWPKLTFPLIVCTFTASHYKQKGYASRLIRHSLGALRQHDIFQLGLFVSPENHDAIHLYRHLGFKETEFPVNH